MNSRPERFKELDAFRGLAALAVAISHLTFHFAASNDFNNGLGLLSDTPKQVVYFSGIIPVSFFFMISGFVIFWTLEKCTSVSDLAVGRISRLYPSYWAGLFIVSFILATDPAARGLTPPDLATLAANIAMVQSFTSHDNIDPVYWSLGYELKFYLMMGVLFFTPLRAHTEKFLLFWLMIGVTFALRAPPPSSLEGMLFELAAAPYAHFFIAGAAFFQRWRGDRRLINTVLLSATAVAPFFHWPPLAAAVMVLAWPLFWLAIKGRLSILTIRPLVFLGTISYALYLVHLPLGQEIEHLLNTANLPAPVIILAALVSAIAIASLITFLIEKPMLRVIRNAYHGRYPSMNMTRRFPLPIK